jgi:hypothetical protein
MKLKLDFKIIKDSRQVKKKMVPDLAAEIREEEAPVRRR